MEDDFDNLRRWALYNMNKQLIDICIALNLRIHAGEMVIKEKFGISEEEWRGIIDKASKDITILEVSNDRLNREVDKASQALQDLKKSLEPPENT